MKFIAMQATSRSTCLSLYRRLSLKAGMIASSLSLGLLVTAPAFACTRILYSGSDNTVITGRSMDWMKDNSPNLWAMPKGVKRDGATGPGSITWAAKYGSVVVSMYDIGTVDGINEKGLVANVLYLAESNYGRANGKPTLSITPGVNTFLTISQASKMLFRFCGKSPFGWLPQPCRMAIRQRAILRSPIRAAIPPSLNTLTESS